MISLKLWALKERVDAIIGQYEDERLGWQRQVDAAKIRHDLAWSNSMRDEWVAYRNKITRLLSSGTRITDRNLGPSPTRYRPFSEGKMSSDGPRGYWVGATHNVGEPPKKPAEKIYALRQYLTMVEGDSITLAELERAGFRGIGVLIGAE